MPGSGLGMLSGINTISNLIGGLIGLGVDYPRAQEAAEATTASQNAAIYGDPEGRSGGAFQTGADRAGQLRDNATGYQARSAASNDATRDAALGNLKAWSDDYWARGGMRGQLAGEMQPGGALASVAANNQAAQQVVSQIPQYQKQYGDQRAAAYETLSQIGSRTDATAQEARDTYDIAGMKAERDKIRDQMFNVRGASEIIGATAPDQAAKSQALRDLEASKHAMTPQQYLAEKQQIEQHYNGMISTKSNAIAAANTKAWADTAARLEENLTAAKAGLTQSLVNLTSSYGANSAAVLNSITASLNGETEFVNQAIANGVNASDSMAALVWDAMKADEKVRATAMVDGPNMAMQAWNQNNLALESQYAAMLNESVNMQSMFDQLGINMQFAYSPAFASMAPYWQGISNAFQTGFDNTMAYRQYGQAGAAASNANEVGWAGVAASAFNPSVSFRSGSGPNAGWGVGV